MPRTQVRFDGVSRGAVQSAAETRAAIRGVGDEADRTGRRFGYMAHYFATRAIFGASVAMGGLAAGTGLAGFRFDDLKQKAQIAFTTMLGSGAKAQAFLIQLQKYAAATPFEFPQLITASQRLLAMGFSA